MGSSRTSEHEVLVLLGRLLPPAVEGDVWFGDDAAVLRRPSGEIVLLASDAVVEGVHFDRGLSDLVDVGWKAMAVNVSDLAAMAGEPVACVVTCAGPSSDDIEPLYSGLVAAAGEYGCPVVGGDLSSAPSLVISIAVLGTTGRREPVLRSGALTGDRIFVTGPLGRSAAGLRVLRERVAMSAEEGDLVAAHRRPRALLAQGGAAAICGATAMIDVSDGLSTDLDRLASASGVGVVLDDVPVAAGATMQEALGGGEDYELIFTAPDADRVSRCFRDLDLPIPIEVGRAVDDPAVRRLRDGPLVPKGYEHQW